MRADYSGAELFFEYIDGRVTASQVLDHPAYRAVVAHANLSSNSITPGDLEAALRGERSSFYGLDRVRERLPEIRTLLQTVRDRESAWLANAHAALAPLFPGEDLGTITLYPIIGYDMGIGLRDAVCMNLNYAPYMVCPEEFGFFIVHEAFHVVYERAHPVAPLSSINSPEEWLSYFEMWVQNEGGATYAPLASRLESGFLADAFGDYGVVTDTGQMREHLADFLHTLTLLGDARSMSRDEHIELLFGSKRLTYRVGCELARRIERSGGLVALQAALRVDGTHFVDDNLYLLLQP